VITTEKITILDFAVYFEPFRERSRWSLGWLYHCRKAVGRWKSIFGNFVNVGTLTTHFYLNSISNRDWIADHSIHTRWNHRDLISAQMLQGRWVLWIGPSINRHAFCYGLAGIEKVKQDCFLSILFFQLRKRSVRAAKIDSGPFTRLEVPSRQIVGFTQRTPLKKSDNGRQGDDSLKTDHQPF